MAGLTRIFISSTCFDLTEIREEISTVLTGIGHDVMVSESSDFPVGFNQDSIETCKHNVKHNTDLFILIIGGRAGWIDDRFDRTVVSLEYDTAKNAGLDILIFAQKPLLESVSNWKADPSYSEHVDSPLVYKLLNNIMLDGYWIESFEKKEEIVQTIKTQLSAHLKRLITEKRGGRFEPLPEFANESPRAKQIALDRPKYWEALLQEELLRTKLDKVRKAYDDLERGLTVRRPKRINSVEFFQWFQDALVEMKDTIVACGKILREDFDKAAGDPGTEGNAVQILAAANALEAMASRLVEWETELKFFVVPQECEELRGFLLGSTKQAFAEIESVSVRISEIFRQPDPTGQHVISLKFSLPWADGEFEGAIERLGNRIIADMEAQ